MRLVPFVAATLAALFLPDPRMAAAENPPAPAAIDPKGGEVPPEEPAWQEPDPYPMPPGSAADQALWKATKEVNSQVGSVRWVSQGLQWKIRINALVNKLNAAAKADPASEGRFLDLRKRLGAAQAENYEILMSRWPVDTTRVCQYPLSHLTSAMYAGDAPDSRALLGEARENATKCLDLARAAVGRMDRSNTALSGVIAEVEKALPAPAPAAGGKK